MSQEYIYSNPFLTNLSKNLISLVDPNDIESFCLFVNLDSLSLYHSKQELLMCVASLINSFSESFIFPKKDLFMETLKDCIEQMDNIKQNILEIDENIGIPTFTFDDVTDVGHVIVFKKLFVDSVDDISLYSFRKK